MVNCAGLGARDSLRLDAFPCRGRGRPNCRSGMDWFTVTKACVLTATVYDAIEALLLLGQPLTEEEGGLRHPYSAPFEGAEPPPPHSRHRWAERLKSEPVRIGVFSE